VSDSTPRVTVIDRDIHLDGRRLAVARSKEAAFVIAFCLNTARSHENMPSYPYADADQRRVQDFFA
jgi:hypothetical protein